MSQAQRRRGLLQATQVPGGGGPGSGGGAGRGWSAARRALLVNQKSSSRLGLGQQGGGPLGGPLGVPVSIPEEDSETDLYLAFRTQASLSDIRDHFYLAIEEKGREQVCSKPDDSSGRLLLHCIGLNTALILNNDGSAGTAGLVDDFILTELLPSYPSAVIEEDDGGHLPFTEVLSNWVKERKAARHRAMLARQGSAKGLADIVQEAAKAFFSKRTLVVLGGDHSTTVNGEGGGATVTERTKLYDLPPLVEWSLGMLSTIITSKTRPYPSSNNRSPNDQFGESTTSDFGDPSELVSEENDADNVEAEFDSLFVINETGIIEMVNDSAVTEFGWSREDFLGSNISMICGQDHGPKHDAYLKAYLKTGVKKVMGKHDRKLFAKRKDGTEFPISLGITETPAVGEGVPRRFCGFVKHRKGAESRKSSVTGVTGQQHPLSTSFRLTESNDSHSDMSSVGQQSLNRPGMAFGAVYNELIVETVAAIPDIIKELLLIEDDAARERVFSLPIVQQVLLCIESFGDGKWLIDLLISDDQNNTPREDRDLASSRRGSVFDSLIDHSSNTCDSAEAAVYYLERVSQLSGLEDNNNSHITMRASEGTTTSFKEKRKILFDKVGNLEGLISSLCTLESDLLKRSAVTRVIQRTLDQEIFSPFALTAALFDGVFHAMFIAAFRLGPAEAIFHLFSTDATFRPQQYLTATIAMVGCIAYFARKNAHLELTKTFAKATDAIWKKLMNVWSVLEVATLLLAAYCMFYIDWLLRSRAIENAEDSEIPFHLRSLVAFTTPLLWFRILNHIKMFNKQLATFILCSVEILSDIKWFMLVLLIIIASFAQMLVSMTFDPLQYQDDAKEYSYFSMDEYLKAYTIMLGDIDSEALQKHSGIVILFVLYTFGVTIVLLNILIAIVSESYVNAVYSSTLMLGKARVMYVAEIRSMKSRYTMQDNKLVARDGTGQVARRNINISCFAFAALSTKLIIRTVMAKLVCLGTSPQLSFLGLTSLDVEAGFIFFVLFGLIVAHKFAMIYSLGSEESAKNLNRMGFGKSTPNTKSKKFLDILADTLHAYISKNIDSLTEEGDDGKAHQVDLPQSGETRTVAGSDRKLHRALNASRKELKAEVKRSSDQLRRILQETDDKTQASIAICEQHISSSLADIAEMQERVDSALAASEERIIDAISLKLENLLKEEAEENSQGVAN